VTSAICYNQFKKHIVDINNMLLFYYYQAAFCRFNGSMAGRLFEFINLLKQSKWYTSLVPGISFLHSPGAINYLHFLQRGTHLKNIETSYGADINVGTKKRLSFWYSPHRKSAQKSVIFFHNFSFIF